MFATKKQSLFQVTAKADKNTKEKKTMNPFLNGLAKESAKTLSGNSALKFSTTGNPYVDQFGKLGSFKTPRSFVDISNDCSTLWAEDKETFVKFTIYIRMISRKTNIYLLNISTKEPQSGAELKHEGIMRMVWLHTKAPDLFWENIGLFISAGNIKDIFTMLKYDLVYNGWDNRVLDWEKMGQFILTLLGDTSSLNLVKKYLPQIRSNTACTTVESQANNIVAKWICSLLFGNKDGNYSSYRKYRKLKVSGTAHEWQQIISRKEFDKLDFKKIHGRALNLLVKSKFLKNQNLSDKYQGWVKVQETIKYTGFVHELLCELSTNRETLFQQTVDKQFLEVVNKVKNGDENLTKFIVVRDTSGSMGSTATGTKFSSGDIAKALALYFSEFLTGDFAGHWIEFSSTAKLHKWKGSTPSERWYNDSSSYVGNTNFQSVINLFVKMKKQGIDESNFPTGILCISDGEFDSSSLSKTNVESALEKLMNAGFSRHYVDNFKIVLWNIQNSFYGRNSGSKFETFGDVKNVYYLSGYSAGNVKFIMNNKVETAEDLFNEALNQELISLVKV